MGWAHQVQNILASAALARRRRKARARRAEDAFWQSQSAPLKLISHIYDPESPVWPKREPPI